MKKCKDCGESFEVTQKELDFLSRVSPEFNKQRFPIPQPVHCPDCRWQRRLTFRNERTLYRRNCDLSGKSVVSIYPADSPFPVYEVTEWMSDKWDATAYGRDVDFSRPFFDQFRELAESVPHPNLFIDPTRDVNSEYTNCASESKNCYLISQAEGNEDCYYSRGINHCRDCVDCLRVDRCELCYEGVNLSLCYHCFYCQDCESSSNCYFSTDLRGCKNCFGCHALVQKEYQFFNEQLSRSEWEQRFQSFIVTRSSIIEQQKVSERIRLSVPHRYARVIQCEDATGDHLNNCRDAHNCYDSRDLEHCSNVYEVQNGAKYCHDYSMWGVNAELIYQCNGCGHNAYNLLFCSTCWLSVSNLMYCEQCWPAAKNCFGCYGVRSLEHCILNKQYTSAEYDKLVARIIVHMQETGEWGEFFPPWASSSAYNETMAHEYFPLSKEEVLQRGWKWRNEEAFERPKSPVKIPESIREVGDDFCDKTLNCEKTGKPFRIIRPELELLRKLGLPLSTLHPEVRHRDRMSRRNPARLSKRFCECCGAEVQSTFPPERPEIVYCEPCYVKAVQ